jgi:outer membrane receptor for ferric coprogen and ferric-rhodotorulic acid
LTIGQYYNGLKVSVFYKKFYDMIIRTQTNISDGNGGYKWQYNNTNEGYMKGINVEYDRKYNNGFGIYAFAELLDGKNDYDYWSKMTPFHSKVKMSQDINVWGNDKVLGEWLYAPKVPDSEMALKDQTDIRIQDHNYGYNIINLGYESKIDSHNKIKLMVNNVFDRTGRVYGSAVDFEERTLNINYTYFF